MELKEVLAAPKGAPDLDIPDSSSTVEVRIIDTTTYGTCSTSLTFTPQLSGLETVRFPSYAFLITNKTQNKHVLFDLGMDTDWEASLPGPTVAWIKKNMPFEIKKRVDEILDANSHPRSNTTTGELDHPTSRDISSIIWSHHHFDHRGDVTKFPPSTELVLGPGFLGAHTPTYPTNPGSSISERELQGRPIRELDDGDFGLEIGGFRAHDFFRDGSFYILSTPGHTVGHVSAIARVTANVTDEGESKGKGKASFVFMGGDCAHHPAIFRPSEYLPLPVDIPVGAEDSNSAKRHSSNSAASQTIPKPDLEHDIDPHQHSGQQLLDQAHPQHSATTPFWKANHGVNTDQPLAEQTISNMQSFDCRENILVIISHDSTILGNVDFYPLTLNDWQRKRQQRYQEQEEQDQTRSQDTMKLKWGFCAEIYDLCCRGDRQ